MKPINGYIFKPLDCRKPEISPSSSVIKRSHYYWQEILSFLNLSLRSKCL